MRAQVLDSDALRAVAPISLHAYLRSQKWQKGDELGQRGVVYENDNHTEIVAPTSHDLADYASAVSRILGALEKEENRSQLSILRDLVVADSDLIRIRAPHADDDGTMPLEAGVELVRQSRDLLLAAACSAVRPQRSYRSGKNREATDYLEKVRLGQTERGSFVVTLLSPVPPVLEHQQPTFWPEISAEPFERKVTRRLVDSLREVKGAIEKVTAGGDIQAFEDRIERGVSANLCEAIAKLVRDGNGVDISMSWAVTRPTPEARAQVLFKESEAEILEEAAKILTSRQSRIDESVEGIVTKLAREQNATEGRVTLKAVIDNQFRSINVYLDKGDYSKAVHAHDARNTIVVDGDLESVGQRWSLKRVRNVEVRPQEPENDESE